MQNINCENTEILVVACFKSMIYTTNLKKPIMPVFILSMKNYKSNFPKTICNL